MISFTIAHDIPGRMRIRYGKDVFSPVEGEVLKRDLSNWTMIHSVEVNSITGSVLMQYDATCKDTLLKKLHNLNLGYLKEADTSDIVFRSQTPEVKAMNAEYKRRFFKIIGKRYFIRWFLPTGIGNAITIYKSLGFIKEGLKSLSQMKVNVPLLDATSIGVSLLQKNFNIAGNIMMLLNISDLLEDYTRKKTNLELSQSLSIQFDKVWIYADGVEQEIPMAKLQKGDIVVSQMGAMIPIDGEVVDGEAMVNEASFTGEPLSRRVVKEDTVFAGTLIEEGKLFIKVRNLQDESRISNIVKMIDTNESLKASIQAKAEHLADSIVPFSFFGFFGILALTRDVTRATSVLMVDYSCAIRLSTSISVISAMLEASNRNVLVKGGKYLEAVKDADVIVFDKTGTMTQGVFEVAGIHHATIPEEKLLEYAAMAESYSTHPISKSLLKAYGNTIDKSRIENVEEISGHGVKAVMDGVQVLAGNDKLMKMYNIPYQECHSVGTIVHMAIDGKYAGHIVISDMLKPHAKEAIEALKKAGIKQTVMLTGDVKSVADKVASELHIDKVYSELLPQDKVNKVEELLSLKQPKENLAFVGDGINDAPVLSRADIGIAMGALGSDAAIEAADIVLMDDDPLKISKAIKIAKKCIHIVYENIYFAIGIKLVCLILGAIGIANMWVAIFADVGVMIIAVLNAIRALNVKNL